MWTQTNLSILHRQLFNDKYSTDQVGFKSASIMKFKDEQYAYVNEGNVKIEEFIDELTNSYVTENYEVKLDFRFEPTATKTVCGTEMYEREQKYDIRPKNIPCCRIIGFSKSA